MKILVVGDIHGDFKEVADTFGRAEMKEADAIVQVGDFGYWEHFDEGDFVDYVSGWTKVTGIPLFWIDGNHENHTMLRALYGPTSPKHEANEDGMWKIRDNVWYIPRGCKWAWDGVEFMGVGGAVSIDKEYRLNREKGLPSPQYGQPNPKPATGPLTQWWPEEQLTDEELEYVKSQGTADVLFTHDCPTNAPFKHRLKNDIDSVLHRQKMNEVGKSVKPRYWFHGHMHEFYDYYFRHDDGDAHVIGLERDGSHANWCLIDTDTIVL